MLIICSLIIPLTVHEVLADSHTYPQVGHAVAIEDIDNFIQSKIRAPYKITHMDIVHRTIEMENITLFRCFNVRPWQLMNKVLLYLQRRLLLGTQVVILPGGVVIGSASLDLSVFSHFVWSETDFSILFTL
jgi:hypothetical protein